MATALPSNLRLRMDFGKIPHVVEIPNLIDIQKRSYNQFLQSDVSPGERQDTGLQAVFQSVFPITDFNENASLEFVEYNLDRPKYDVGECHQRGMTYAAPMKVVIRLVVWDVDSETGSKSLRDVKEQEVYFGEIPLMTDQGTFVINGTERVVVSQLHRSPGVFFDHDKGKTQASGKIMYSCRVIPYRGSWLDFEFDAKDILHVRIDRRRKMPATVLLRALGYTPEQLLHYYYDAEVLYLGGDDGYSKAVTPESLERMKGQRSETDIVGPKNKVLVKEGKKITSKAIKEIKAAKLDRLPLLETQVVGAILAEDIVDLSTGEVMARCNDAVTADLLIALRETDISSVEVFYLDGVNAGPYLRNTLLVDRIEEDPEQGKTAQEIAIEEIYRRLRPGDPPTMVAARNLFRNLFFNPERYDLSKVGRLKSNHKFSYMRRAKDIPEFQEAGWEAGPPLDHTVLTQTDILEAVRYLMDLKDGVEGCKIDDIDHLGNRRVRAVGELMENQYRIGLVRMERAIKERMSMSQELETLMPHDLVNAKPVSAVVKEYFGSSQLSQFMDQTNPLSEVTHKRRLSALGPGGLTRERAGFEVRDVHPTHYGRICPIETPEGPNIGLIASLSTYARVNAFGFVETPYRKVENGKATNDVSFYSALDERDQVIAQANAHLDTKNNLVDEYVSCRVAGEFAQVKADEVTLMDVSPKQLVSVAASLIPFLENDDANRALMGSNMQRQAVPLLRTRSPLVGTGVEDIVAQDSGVTAVARHDGVVEKVDATRIVVKRDPSEDDPDASTKPDIYNLVKFQRSNQNTCINHKPIVKPGEAVKKGAVIADGPATQNGELALGQNAVVAFMPWGGYNFEDSILISERMVKDDVFTSIHIEEFECIARDTKLGKEEITRDIPNVGEEALKDVDESGIIRIGAEVRSSDILVGKITPKGETQLSPEEKLLRAIFGEKAGDVRDTSLRMPPGAVGTVIGAKIFSRRGAEKDERTIAIEDAEEARLLKDQNDEIKIIREAAFSRVGDLLDSKKTAAKVVDESGRVLIAKGKVLNAALLADVPQRFWGDVAIVGAADTEERIERLLSRMRDQVELVKGIFQDKIEKVRRGDELPPGVIKMVKVYVAIKRKLQVGDKMAGRHGNKGVISQILPEEDMPFLDDGTPVDFVLNPLGVPSRMNVGQILETHLGWAAKHLGQQMANLIEAAEKSKKTIKERIKKMYASDRVSKLVDELDDEGLMELVGRIREGIKVATPVFDGATEEEIRQHLREAGLAENGQSILRDGRTGKIFEQTVTVGVMYMLKLHHLVDDKIHARSIGPYSLVTQQPLGGKAQFGGQRLGEMEVWAMEAYGAAYGLQEFLTVKSDDVVGRTRMYEAIVKGENTLESGLPESFNVLMKELQSLALDIQLIEAEETVTEEAGAGLFGAAVATAGTGT